MFTVLIAMDRREGSSFQDDNDRAVAKAKESILLMKKKMFRSHDLILQYNNKLKEFDRLKGDLCVAQEEATKLCRENNANRAKLAKLEAQIVDSRRIQQDLEKKICDQDDKIASDKCYLEQLICKIKGLEEKHSGALIEADVKKSALEERVKELDQELKKFKKLQIPHSLKGDTKLSRKRKISGKDQINVKGTIDIGVNTTEVQKPVAPQTLDASILTDEFYHIRDNPYPIFCHKCEALTVPSMEKFYKVMTNHPPLLSVLSSPPSVRESSNLSPNVDVPVESAGNNVARELRASPSNSVTPEIENLKKKLSTLERKMKKRSKQIARGSSHPSTNCCTHSCPTNLFSSLATSHAPAIPNVQNDLMAEFWNRIMKFAKESPPKSNDTRQKLKSARNKKSIKLKNRMKKISKKKKRKDTCVSSTNWQIESDDCTNEMDDTISETNVRTSNILRLKPSVPSAEQSPSKSSSSEESAAKSPEKSVGKNRDICLSDEEILTPKKKSERINSSKASPTRTSSRIHERRLRSLEKKDRTSLPTNETFSFATDPEIDHSKPANSPQFSPSETITKVRKSPRCLKKSTVDSPKISEHLSPKSMTLGRSFSRSPSHSTKSQKNSMNNQPMETSQSDSDSSFAILKNSTPRKIGESLSNEFDEDFSESHFSEGETPANNPSVSETVNTRKRKRSNSPKIKIRTVQSKLLGKIRALKKNTTRIVTRGSIISSTEDHSNSWPQAENISKESGAENNEKTADNEPIIETAAKRQRIAHVPKKSSKEKHLFGDTSSEEERFSTREKLSQPNEETATNFGAESTNNCPDVAVQISSNLDKLNADIPSREKSNVLSNTLHPSSKKMDEPTEKRDSKKLPATDSVVPHTKSENKNSPKRMEFDEKMVNSLESSSESSECDEKMLNSPENLSESMDSDENLGENLENLPERSKYDRIPETDDFVTNEENSDNFTGDFENAIKNNSSESTEMYKNENDEIQAKIQTVVETGSCASRQNVVNVSKPAEIPGKTIGTNFFSSPKIPASLYGLANILNRQSFSRMNRKIDRKDNTMNCQKFEKPESAETFKRIGAVGEKDISTTCGSSNEAPEFIESSPPETTSFSKNSETSENVFAENSASGMTDDSPASPDASPISNFIDCDSDPTNIQKKISIDRVSIYENVFPSKSSPNDFAAQPDPGTRPLLSYDTDLFNDDQQDMEEPDVRNSFHSQFIPGNSNSTQLTKCKKISTKSQNVVEDLRTKQVVRGPKSAASSHHGRGKIDTPFDEDIDKTRDPVDSANAELGTNSLGTLLTRHLAEAREKKKVLGKKFHKVAATKLLNENETTVRNELEKLVESEEWSSNIHISVVTRLCQVPSRRTVSKGIVDCLIERASSGELLDRTYTPPAPVMTKTQQRFAALIYSLERDPRMSGILELVRAGIVFNLFRLGCMIQDEVVSALARMYTVIARMKKDRESARIFCLDALYFLGRQAVNVIHVVSTIWPEVFPLYGTRTDELVNCVVHLIRLDQSPKAASIKRLLKDYYKYPDCPYQSAVLMRGTMDSLTSRYTGELEASILLMSKREGTEWAKKHVVNGGLWKIVEDVNYPSSLNALTLLGFIVRTYPTEDTDKAIATVFEKLCSMFGSAENSPEKEEGIVSALLSLARFVFLFNKIAHTILKWSPSQAMRPTTIEQLNSFFKLRTLDWWNKRKNKLKLNAQA